MSRMGTLYIEKDSFFHRLDGSAKLLLFMTWTIITFMFLDIRVFLFMTLLGIAFLYLSQIPFQRIQILVWVMLTFNLINSLFILVITPAYGSELTGTSTGILAIGYHIINLETIFYVMTLSLKYANLLPITLVFIFTTHPSRFASSLNKIGVPYKIAYAVNISLRYIPDIQQELKNILFSQQARGVGFKKGEAPFKQRIKNITSIAVPLITSALQRIEVVSNAMDLRGFGKHKKRTWYNRTSFQAMDYVVFILCIGSLALAIWLKVNVLQTFWYPF
ncbi:MAG TPA: energy-coupling factor transporter transmembrane component T [Bacillus sp. (in: firmicutes)]|nr:energy-coupling factor transporter transmembrane component T [Bacillus sp. (in: firmicutes)]